MRSIPNFIFSPAFPHKINTRSQSIFLKAKRQQAPIQALLAAQCQHQQVQTRQQRRLANSSNVNSTLLNQPLFSVLASNEDPASQATKNDNAPPETTADVDDQTIRLKFLDDTEKIVRTKLTSTVLEFKK
jgi:type II secretory pathway pseudopilin PulG